MPTPPKLCIDCKHCASAPGYDIGYRCKSPESAVVSLVDGSSTPRDCENARNWHLCGADAKFWEAKEGAR